MTKLNGTCEKVYSDSTDEENAAEADTPDSEDSETEAAKATYDDDEIDDEIDEEIATPNKQIKELKDKIKVLRRENTALKIKSGILNMIKTCFWKETVGTLVFLTSFVLLISTNKGVQILNSARANFARTSRMFYDSQEHVISGAPISVIRYYWRSP